MGAKKAGVRHRARSNAASQLLEQRSRIGRIAVWTRGNTAVIAHTQANIKRSTQAMSTPRHVIMCLVRTKTANRPLHVWSKHFRIDTMNTLLYWHSAHATLLTQCTRYFTDTMHTLLYWHSAHATLLTQCTRYFTDTVHTLLLRENRTKELFLALKNNKCRQTRRSENMS